MIFIPHEYQKYTIDYIKTHPVAAAFLDCGLGKTVISLSALKDLIESGEVKKALVIAPLRVARDVWPVEVEKWDHLNGLKVSVILGSKKQREEALQADAQIYVINRDNLSWLVSQKWPIYMFDTIVLDELSSFKNMRAARTRAAYRLCREAKRVIGLTGTPASNGLMDPVGGICRHGRGSAFRQPSEFLSAEVFQSRLRLPGQDCGLEAP